MSLVKNISDIKNIEYPVLYRFAKILKNHEAKLRMSPSGDFTSAFSLYAHGEFITIFHSHMSSDKLRYEEYKITDPKQKAFFTELLDFFRHENITISGCRDECKITNYAWQELKSIKGDSYNFDINPSDIWETI